MASVAEPSEARGAEPPQQPDNADGDSVTGTFDRADTSPGTEPRREPDPVSPPDEGARPAAPAHPDPLAVQRTRLGDLWVMLSFGAAILVLLLVFVLQNGQRVEIHLYGAHWNAPVGVALLMAAAFGVLLVVVPGTGRIIQLKRAARRLHTR
ncbi:LapA family protein [Actinospica robiniae]|uniref:LapA family protein n=1 Tax=Actinospica robiniae TaxID=304901 RepID=UPI000419E402|nr:LapA family protein [Actinospica robiniae]